MFCSLARPRQSQFNRSIFGQCIPQGSLLPVIGTDHGNRVAPSLRQGDGAAHVVVFSSADKQTEGAQSRSSEWRTVPEDKDYGSIACNIVLNPRTGMIMEPSDGTKKKTAHKSNQVVLAPKSNQGVLAPNQGVLGTKSNQDVLATQARPCTEQPELRMVQAGSTVQSLGLQGKDASLHQTRRRSEGGCCCRC